MQAAANKGITDTVQPPESAKPTKKQLLSCTASHTSVHAETLLTTPDRILLTIKLIKYNLMKTKKLFILALLTTVTSVSNAQNSKFTIGFGTDLGMGGKEYKIVTPNAFMAYDITPRLSLGIRAEDAITLRNTQGIKSGDNIFTLGGQVSYDVCHIFSTTKVQPRFIVGHTIGADSERGYLYYQGGIYLKADKKEGIQSEFGIGIRYNTFMTDLYKDKTVFYVSYGFVLR